MTKRVGYPATPKGQRIIDGASLRWLGVRPIESAEMADDDATIFDEIADREREADYLDFSEFDEGDEAP